MAIQKSVSFKGLEIPNCYIKVEEFQGDKSTVSAVVSFRATSDDEVLFVERFKDIEYSPEGDNPLASIYNHLKTLPEFEGAKDC